MKYLQFFPLLFLSFSTYSQRVFSDTTYIQETDFWLNIPDGTILCSLMCDFDDVSFEYYSIHETDSLVYCLKYRNGLLEEEGLMCLYRVFDNNYCWGLLGTWKFYMHGIFDRLEFIDRETSFKYNTAFSLNRKFKVICREF
jgi:hypothetical protein